jgi:hypothetical protein
VAESKNLYSLKLKKKVHRSKAQKSPDEVISELITQRKVQQEALIKIQASVDKKKSKSMDLKNDNPITRK